jgi:hypothetical protein
MMDRLNHKPNGFARYVSDDKKIFNDGQVKNAKTHGYSRTLRSDGTYSVSEDKEGKYVRILS